MAVSAIALGIGAAAAIYGGIKQDQARKAASKNTRPVYQTPPEEADNLSLAKNLAGTGISPGAYQQMLNNSDRGFATGANAIAKNGGDPNAIGNLYDKYSNGINQLSIYNDTASMTNLKNLQEAYMRSSANKDKEFQVNQYGPYADKAQAIAGQMQGAQNWTNSGFNLASSGAMGLAARQLKAKQPGTTPESTPIDTSPNYGSGGYSNFNSPAEAPGQNAMSNNIDVNAPAGQIYGNAWSNDNHFAAPPPQAPGPSVPVASGDYNMVAGPYAPASNNNGAFGWNGFYPVANQ